MIKATTLSEMKFHDKVDMHLIIQHQSFFIKAAADLLEEEQTAIQQLIETVENVFVAGINHYHNTNTESTDVYIMAKSFAKVKISDNMADNFENGYLLMKGGGAVTEIFGNKLGTVLNHVAVKAGVKPSTVYTYICLYATVVLKSLGDQVNNTNMAAVTFVKYLASGRLGLTQSETTQLFGESVAEWNVEANEQLALVDADDTETNNNVETRPWKKLVSFVLLGLLVASVYIIHKNRSFEHKTSLPSSIQQVKLIGISKS